jgi:16S rRNA (cytidine1402-2'-O)-methyltransferase
MMASGLNGQSFAFNGYLPIKPAERAKSLKTLERRAKMEHQSQLFIEAPYRNVKLAEQILEVCAADTRLVIACDITSPDEFISMKSVAEWRRAPLPDIAKRPTIFIIG